MWNPGGNAGNRGGFVGGGGRGRSSGTFRGGRGRGLGRGPGGDYSGSNGGTGEQALLQTCTYYARGGGCRTGDSCRFRHVAVSIFSPQAHKAPIKALDVMHMGDVPKILTGSTDCTVSVRACSLFLVFNWFSISCSTMAGPDSPLTRLHTYSLFLV